MPPVIRKRPPQILVDADRRRNFIVSPDLRHEEISHLTNRIALDQARRGIISVNWRDKQKKQQD